MKRSIYIFLIGGFFGFCGGAGAMLGVYPFFFPPAVVNETVADISSDMLLGETRFREDASGQDALHWGRGGVKIHRAANGDVLLALENDFEVGPGPNFWLYLNSVSGVDDEDDFRADEARVRVTKLKSFTGAQVYTLKAALFKRAGAVTIWCETFGQYIASADIPALATEL